MILPPFNKSVVKSVSSSLGANRLSSLYRTKLPSEILISGFTYANIWRGSSEIVLKFHYSFTQSFSIINVERGFANFCACISWIENEVTKRYKLWNNVGEILYYPLYTNQKITSDYTVELWNTDFDLLICSDITLSLSRLVAPSNRCCGCLESNTIVVEDSICTDKYIILEDFIPTEDYVWIDTCGIILVPSIIISINKLNLLADDGTVHSFTLIQESDGDGGTFITYSVNQANSGLTPNARLTLDGSTYNLSSILEGGNYLFSIADAVTTITGDPTYYAMLSTDGYVHLVYLTLVDGDAVINIL